MKKIISFICVLAFLSAGAFAQNQKKDGKDWREKVRAERVAFLTNELDLTEAEAQAFWPVYNQVQKERREAFHNLMKAYKALNEAGDCTDADTGKLLDDYLAAKGAADRLELEAVERFKKVLPTDKVGRLVVAEEKYRHVQIDRLGQGGPQSGEKKSR